MKFLELTITEEVKHVQRERNIKENGGGTQILRTVLNMNLIKYTTHKNQPFLQK